MKTEYGKLVRALPLFVLLSLGLLLLPGESWAQLGLRVPPPPQTVSLFEPSVLGLESVAKDSMLFRALPSSYKRTVTMDSSGHFISFEEGIDNTEFLLPAVVDLNTYIRLRSEFEIRELWKKTVVNALKNKMEKSSGAIELNIPFRIKSKVFTRIFGSDRIGLRVTGNITFDLSGRTEKRSGSAISAIQNQNTFSPRFKQTQQFTVEGKIGDKVTVSVEQNSEATVDIDNTLKLHYNGDKDEIVQKIEAGNISLTLPSTKYVIFGGSNKGLFGLKSQMQMGNLYMTAIASLEKGQQQQLTLNGSASESKVTIKDYDFIKNRYFFADMAYRNQFENGLKDNPTIFAYTAGQEILQLEVWESSRYDDPEARRAIADVDPAKYLDVNLQYKKVDYDTVSRVEGKVEKGYFRRLELGKDYTFDKYRGFFVLNQSIENNKILAIAFATAQAAADPSIPTIGTLNEALGDTSQVVVLKLIKPRAMQPFYTDTWPLMMRNVYSLGGSNIEKAGFNVRLENNVNGDHATYPKGSDKSYLNLLQLDVLDENNAPVDGGDNKIDNNPYIVDYANGILIFPALQPFDPQKGSRFRSRIPKQDLVNIYNLSEINTTAFLDSSKFEMIVTSKSTKSTFGLGFYVLEGSDVVTLGGRTLERDKDYSIDYFSGQLTLLSNEAKRSSSQIQIKYERANLFQLNKKTIFGSRLEYRFFDNSFVGLTALYLNKTTLDRRVRVGQEPFHNFVWDVNAAFKFKPRIITRIINALPGMETSAESHINIEGEFAQVLPNPNTLDNPGTHDNNGVAYVDDFEASKRTTTLGIPYKTWTMASVPAVLPDVSNDEIKGKAAVLKADAARQHIVWFNPYHQTLIKDIWPNRDVNAQTGQTTTVLGIDYWRDTDSNPDSAWAGIMRSTINFANQQKTKYIEMWIKGDTGTVNIDIGRISEDWYLKGKTVRGESSYDGLNTEDKNSNGLLELEEDTGIDGIPNGSPGDDPDDNWREPQRNALDMYDGIKYDGINGTEGDHNSRGTHYPDTEDLDGDGQLSTTNQYFEYSFSLDPNDPQSLKWIAGSTDKGWRLFRIPIKEFNNKIGQPDSNFQQIFFTRLWLSQLPKTRHRLLIATFDFVGNEWEESGIADNEKSPFHKNDSLFTLATYNTEENAEAIPGGPEPYTSPPGVTGVRDRITKAMSKEQSLVMRLFGLKPGQIAQARKTLYQPLDLLNYKNMRMFVHGDRSLPEKPPDITAGGDTLQEASAIRFYLRFGSDNNNYYEYGQDVYKGWNAVNTIDIKLDEMAAVKSVDSLNIGTLDSLVFVKKLAHKPGGYYKARGNPSLKNIRYFIIGVKHRGDEVNRDPAEFTGEIWLDELRLSNVRKQNATALRLSADVGLADLMSFNAQWESKDADFHNVGDHFGKGNTDERQNYSGKLNVDKFLPDSWDLQIPVDGRASFSRSIPKFRPKTDELTGYQNNTVSKKLKSLFGLRNLDPRLESEINQSKVYGMGVTIKKRSKSRLWYIHYLLDGLYFDFDYSRKKSSNWEYAYNRSEQYKETFKYSIPFGRNNYFEPFKFLKKVPVLKKLHNQKFYYTPSSANMALNVSDAKSEQARRQTPSVKRVVNTGSVRSLNASYKLLPSLDFSYSRSHKADADIVGLNHKELLKEIFTKGKFGLDTDVNQSFKGSYRPKLVDWLQTNLSYNNNFSYQLTNGTDNARYKNASSKVTKNISLTLSPGKLLKSIYTPKNQHNKRRGRRGRRSRNTKKSQNQQTKNKKQGEKKKISFPNPLLAIYNALAGWRSIKTTISRNDRISNRYLSGLPDWRYQFGFSQSPGVPQDTSLNVNLVGPTISKTISVRTTTGFSISKYISASLSQNYNTQESQSDYGSNRSGSASSSYLVLGDDPKASYKGLSSFRAFVPDWTVNVKGLEKFLFFPIFAKSVSLNHGHASKYSENLTLTLNKTFEPTTQTFTNNWQPLVGIAIQTKWGVSANMRWTNSSSFSYTRGGGATKTVTDAKTISLTYAMRGGFKVPLPFWPFKGRTIKNEINFNFTFDSSKNQTFQKQFTQKSFQIKQDNKSWKLRPSATYRFSSRVQGSFFYETGATENKISGKYSYNEFGINVNIAIHD